MTATKDSDNKVVVHFSTDLRVWGGFFVLFGGGLTYAFAYGFSQDIDADIVELLWFMLPLIFVWFGILFLGYTSKFIFNHTRGSLTIRSIFGPIPYRNRTFSKKEILTPKVSKETSEGVTLWKVSLRMRGREKSLNIIVNNESKATYLAERIRAFKSSV